MLGLQVRKTSKCTFRGHDLPKGAYGIVVGFAPPYYGFDYKDTGRCLVFWERDRSVTFINPNELKVTRRSSVDVPYHAIMAVLKARRIIGKVYLRGGPDYVPNEME